MTIAKRLIVLLAVPLLILVGLGIFVRVQLARIEDRSRFVAETRVVALARLGDISRSFAKMRVNVRNSLLATSLSAEAAARTVYDNDRADPNRLLDDYAGKRVTSDQCRRFLNNFRTMSRDLMTDANHSGHGQQYAHVRQTAGESARPWALPSGRLKPCDTGPGSKTRTRHQLAPPAGSLASRNTIDWFRRPSRTGEREAATSTQATSITGKQLSARDCPPR